MEKMPVLAVGAICVHAGEMLLIRRGHPPAQGRWSLPGGRVESGELLIDALRREVMEETSLEVQVGALAGILEVPGDTHYVILDYFAEVIGDDLPQPGDDVTDVKWVPLDEVETMELTPRFVETLRGWGALP